MGCGDGAGERLWAARTGHTGGVARGVPDADARFESAGVAGNRASRGMHRLSLRAEPPPIHNNQSRYRALSGAGVRAGHTV